MPIDEPRSLGAVGLVTTAPSRALTFGGQDASHPAFHTFYRLVFFSEQRDAGARIFLSKSPIYLGTLQMAFSLAYAFHRHIPSLLIAREPKLFASRFLRFFLLDRLREIAKPLQHSMLAVLEKSV